MGNYIGQLPTTGVFQKLDAISTVNDQAAYTMQLDGANFSPESPNNMLVTVNGILQSPTTNYTISGSTITFTSALVTGDVINSIMILGDVLNVGTPSDATVTNAKTNFVSTSSAAGLSIKGDGTTDGTVQLNCSQNSHGVKIASPAHSSGQSYTIKLPTENIAADKIMKVASISGSGTTAIGQMSFVDEPSPFAKLLETNTITDASNTFYTQFNNLNSTYGSTYNAIRIVATGVRPETANRTFNLRCSASAGGVDNGGSDYSDSHIEGKTTSVGTTGSTGRNAIYLADAVGDGSGNKALSMDLFAFDIFNTSRHTLFVWKIGHDAGSATNTPVISTGAAYRHTTSALENVAFGFNNFSDNPGIHIGVFKLYGVNV